MDDVEKKRLFGLVFDLKRRVAEIEYMLGIRRYVSRKVEAKKRAEAEKPSRSD